MVNAFSLAERITRSVSRTTNQTPVDAKGLRRVEAGALSIQPKTSKKDTTVFGLSSRAEFRQPNGGGKNKTPQTW